MVKLQIPTNGFNIKVCMSRVIPPASWVPSCSLCRRPACQTSPHAPLAKCLSRSYTLPCLEPPPLPMVKAPLVLSRACGSCKRTGCAYPSGSSPVGSSTSASCECCVASGAKGVPCSATGQRSNRLSFDTQLPNHLEDGIGVWARAWGPGMSATISTRLEGSKAARGSADLSRHRINGRC